MRSSVRRKSSFFRAPHKRFRIAHTLSQFLNLILTLLKMRVNKKSQDIYLAYLQEKDRA